MTTPGQSSVPAPTNIALTSQPTQVATGYGQQSLLFQNQDVNNNIFVSYQNSVAPFASNAIQIPPLGSVTVSGMMQWWGCSDVTATLLVVPGGTQWTASPAQIAGELAGLATAIAEAIAESGVSLLAASELLYQSASQQDFAGPLGVVVNLNDYGLPTYTGTAQLFDTYTSTNMGNQFTKVFLNEGQWTITPQMQQLGTVAGGMGAGLLVAIKANRAGGPNDPPTTGNPNPFYGDPITTAERTNLANWIQSMQQAGYTFDVNIWSEPNDQDFFPTPASYQEYCAWYGPVVCNPGAFVTTGTASPVNLIYDPGASDIATAVSYWPGTLTGVTWHAICCDFYIDAYFTPHWTIPVEDYLEPLYALANSLNLPFGLGEWGYNHADETGYPYFQTYCNYITSLFTARMAAGQQTYILNYWNSSVKHTTCTVDGPDDPKVIPIQSVFNALNSSGTLLTIPAGETVTVAPVTPSPVANYAPADSMSVDISLADIQATVSGQTNPFLTLTYEWFDVDSLSAVPIETAIWYIPIGFAGANGGTFASGPAPQHGAYMQVQLTNNDTVPCTLVLSISSNGRTVNLDSLRWDAPSSAPIDSYTLPGGVGYTNTLGTIKATLIAGASTTRILSLFAGDVWVSFNQTGATAANEIEIEIQPLPLGAWHDGAPILNTFASAFPLAGPLPFPRVPCQVTLSNNQGSGSVTVYATFIAKGG